MNIEDIKFWILSSILIAMLSLIVYGEYKEDKKVSRSTESDVVVEYPTEYCDVWVRYNENGFHSDVRVCWEK